MRTAIIYLAFVAILGLGLPARGFADDRWNYVDNENLKFILDPEQGLQLRNETPCDIVKIEIQTFPRNSSSISRLFGTGSFYYKIDSLPRSKEQIVLFKDFSNKNGEFLDLKRYDFDRFGIFATKCPGKDEKYFGTHFSR